MAIARRCWRFRAHIFADTKRDWATKNSRLRLIADFSSRRSSSRCAGTAHAYLSAILVDLGKQRRHRLRSGDCDQLLCRNVAVEFETMISINPALGTSALQFFRVFQQLDHAFEQTAGAAAIDAAMIEAQCNLRFSLWSKFLFRFIPRGNFFPSAEAKEQCLIWQRDRRAPFHSERSEIRNGCYAASLHVRRNPPLS